MDERGFRQQEFKVALLDNRIHGAWSFELQNQSISIRANVTSVFVSGPGLQGHFKSSQSPGLKAVDKRPHTSFEPTAGL